MRVAVLGASYAGPTVARRLERRLPEEAALVVVDDSGTHLVQHELHRVVRRPLPGSARVDYGDGTVRRVSLPRVEKASERYLASCRDRTVSDMSHRSSSSGSSMQSA